MGWLASIALCVPLAALCAEAPRPTPVAGASAGYRGRLLGIECSPWVTGGLSAEGLLLSTCAGYTLESSLEHDLNPVRVRDASGKTLVEFRPYAPLLSFPLAVGKRWRGQFTGFTASNNLVWDGEANCTVAAQEPVSVPAGDFDSLRIECEEGWRVGPKNGSAQTTRWYVPALGAVVKEQHRGTAALWDFELASYALPGVDTADLALPPSPSASQQAPPEPRAAPAPKAAAPGILDPDEY